MVQPAGARALFAAAHSGPAQPGRLLAAFALRDYRLRRLVLDGPADVLDVAATVEKAARLGFYLAPIYRRRQRNHAQLILLVDQGSSMTPFHRFTRDLVETAQAENSLEQVHVFYFANLPSENVYLDAHLTQPYALKDVFGFCSPDISTLLVSDAGAARGNYRPERIEQTAMFLAQLQQHTHLIAWLNPMPQARWPGSSAQIIAHLAPMFQMDEDGISSAVDVARGQLLAPSLRS